MNVCEYWSGSMQQLKTDLEKFFVATHDAHDSSDTWNDIRMSADSLILDFSTALAIEDYVDSHYRSDIAALLQRAADIMPPDIDPRVVEQLQSHISEILLSKAEEV